MRQRKSSIISYIEKRFYQYPKIKAAVFEARNDAAHAHTGGNGSGHSYVSDPTANVAIRAATPLKAVTITILKNQPEIVRRPEDWLSVVEATYKKYKGDITESVLKCRYAGENNLTTCTDLHISKNVYYCIVREANNYALACACQLGLIKVF